MTAPPERKEEESGTYVCVEFEIGGEPLGPDPRTLVGDNFFG